MPEYSSTTITPADSVKTPAMNGSTSGNYELSALKAYILASKGLANGLASLDANGKLPTSQLPDLADDVLVYGSYALLPSPGTAGKLYITADDNKMYRWDDALATPAYVELSVDLSDYATKAEVAEAVEDLEAADTDLKNACEQRDSALSKRVANLEKKAGDEITITYPDTTSEYHCGMDEVPPGVAPYAKVKTLIGVSRVHNSLVPLASALTKSAYSASDISACKFRLTVTSNSSTARIEIPNSYIVGHRYAIEIEATTPVAVTLSAILAQTWQSIGTTTANTKFTYSAVFTKDSDYSSWLNMALIVPSTDMSIGATVDVTIILRDLTQYFSSDPSVDVSTLTISDIQSKYPELLIPSDYDAGSIVDIEYGGAKSTSINIWNEELEGGILQDNGSVVPSAGRVTTSFIPVLPSTKYYMLCPSGAYSGRIATYGIGKSFINYNSGGIPEYAKTFTTDANTYWVRITLGSGYGTTYNNDIQVCLDSETEKTTYHPHLLDTLSLPSPVILRSAGSVHEELDVESGKKTNPLGEIDFKDIPWSYDSTNAFFMYQMSSRKAGTDFMATGYTNIGSKTDPEMASVPNMSIASNSDSGVWINVKNTSYTDVPSFKAGEAGKKLLYAKKYADPDTQLTPILDPFIQVEGGGTIRPVQSQTTKIDSSMTAEYLGV